MLDLSPYSAEQRAAILAGDGPLLLLAGPGSGKTAVLAARIAYLTIARNVEPQRILAITFSRKAAGEMRARLLALLGMPGEQVDVTTFHAFGLRLVRQWSQALGYPSSHIAVIDTAAAGTLLRSAAQMLMLEPPSWHCRNVRESLEQTRLNADLQHDRQDSDMYRLAGAYEDLLRERGMVDYPAMLRLPHRLFQLRPDALAALQATYRHILVDEFQDVCSTQYTLARLLAQQHRNLYGVGDPLQTLYAWRGANPRFAATFQRDFPDGPVLGLTQNFRSTGQIVTLANVLAAPILPERMLWTANPAGQIPTILVVETPRHEAAVIARAILRLLDRGTILHPQEVAILYRTNRQAAALRDALASHGLPAGVLHGSTQPSGSQPQDQAQEDAEPDDAAIEALLDALDAEAIHQPAAANGGVQLMTIHAAKGSEWPVVFIAGAEDGLLPWTSGADGAPLPAQIEASERCLAYVAVTRARLRLYLTCCRRRFPGTPQRHGGISRFFRHLPDSVLKQIE